MREYYIDVRNDEKKIYNKSDKFFGADNKGNTIGFTNYYMKVNDKLFVNVNMKVHKSSNMEM